MKKEDRGVASKEIQYYFSAEAVRLRIGSRFEVLFRSEGVREKARFAMLKMPVFADSCGDEMVGELCPVACGDGALSWISQSGSFLILQNRVAK